MNTFEDNIKPLTQMEVYQALYNIYMLKCKYSINLVTKESDIAIDKLSRKANIYAVQNTWETYICQTKNLYTRVILRVAIYRSSKEPRVLIIDSKFRSLEDQRAINIRPRQHGKSFHAQVQKYWRDK